MGRPRLKTVDTSLLRVPQYCCDVEGCRKYFSKLSRLKYHQNTHLAEKPYKCTHEGCKSAYYRPNHLKRHVESIHKSAPAVSESHRCIHDGCKASFDSETSLFFHTKRKHCAELLHCSFCDKTFSKKWKVKEHEAGHTGGSPFKCESEGCTEEFKDYTLFRAHKREHEKRKSKEVLTCPADGCDLTFEKWSELVSHKKACHPLGTQCQICGKTFTQRNLKLHLPIHQEGRHTYQCNYDGCPRFYFHQKNLNHHVKVKHEGQGFNCTLCDRKLSTKQKLLQHIDIIHKRNPSNSPKKKKKSNLLNKITTLTDKDWTLKKTGPPRFVRKKYDCIKFPDSYSDEDIKSSSQINTVTKSSVDSNYADGNKLDMNENVILEPNLAINQV